MTTHIENVTEYDFAAHPQKQYILRSVGGGMAFERIVSNVTRIRVEEYGAPEWESSVVPIRTNVLLYRDLSKKGHDKATNPWTKNDRYMIPTNYNLADFYTKIYEMQT